MAQFRVQFKVPWASYNAGEIGYFTSPSGGHLVALPAIGTALDALPAGATVKAPPSHRLLERSSLGGDVAATAAEYGALASV